MHRSSYEKACWGISKSAVAANKQEIWLSPAWSSGASVSSLIPTMTKFSRGDRMALWWKHADTVTLGDQSSIWKTLPTLLTLVHKIVPTPESDLRPPNYITWDQAAVLKYKWMEINFRTKVLQKTNKGSPRFFFYSHIYLFKSFKIYLFIFGWAGLHCYAWTFSGCGQWGQLSSFGALASHLLASLFMQSTGSRVWGLQ